MEIKCIYCKKSPCGMINTAEGYACPQCLLDKIDHLTKINRVIWCQLPITEMLELAARKISDELPPPIDYIRKSESLDRQKKELTEWVCHFSDWDEYKIYVKEILRKIKELENKEAGQ